ncbi:MAG: redoxin domain-containing protein, partial [Chloroflexi bacterium]|nr:redoxin domain-containing protein [Chloroflexota bacterium]
MLGGRGRKVGLKAGDRAPDFSLKSDSGEVVNLRDFAGRKVAVYFYPKDDTPGCTKEACSFRDSTGELADAGIAVVG